MSWLILVDNVRDFPNAETPHKVMTARDYLNRPQVFRDAKPRIVNLSRSYGYQGTGYYCSLLAEARGHGVIPGVETMIELSKKALYKHALPELEDQLNRTLRKLADPPPDGFTLLICFGRARDARFERFARLVFDWFRAPVLEVKVKAGEWRAIASIRARAINDLDAAEMSFAAAELERHTRSALRAPRVRASLRYSLAVLHDPKEQLPPSSPASLRHFARIAERHGVEVEMIQKPDLDRLAEFDALFIRETTQIDNHTYRFARRAVREGMPVIDDPVSMIRCTNKVYLAELLTARGVPTPKTVIVQSVKQAADLPGQVGWPIVLKIPDGSFSRGVFKLDDAAALAAKLKEMLADSDLVLAQEFAPTSFDWRIGVIDGEPLFACQYLMAKKHWQIVRHEPGKAPDEGHFQTFALDRTPSIVVDTAVRAARLIGRGFYGVDLKETANGVVVIEVNDNPNLEHGVEDRIGGDAIWDRLVRWFVTRLEQR